MPKTYLTPQWITITCLTPGVTIRYTTNGSEPNESSTEYSSPIYVDSTTTIKAKAFKTDWEPSDTQVAIYTITGTCATPTFLPDEGIYNENQLVSITSSYPPEVVIYYTLDGSEPSTDSLIYSSPILIEKTTVIKAIAVKEDWGTSSVSSATYTLKVTSPTFNPLPGLYTTSQDVVISCATSGATIRYTTDGTEPTESSPLYSGPINIPLDTTITLKAKAFKTDWEPSDTISGIYTITGKVLTPIISPVAGVYDKDTNITITTGTPGALIYYTTDGSDPTTSSNLYTAPFILNGSWTVKAIAVKTDWEDSDIATNNYALYKYYLYVPNNTGNSISIFKINDDGTLNSVGTHTGLAGNGPRSIAVHPDGNYIYVTENSGNKIESFKVNSNGTLTSLGSQTVTAAWGVTVNPNGNYLYVTDNTGNSINVLSITNGVLGSPISIALGQNGPRDIEFANAQTNKFIYVPCFGGNRIVMVNVSVDGSTLTVGATINPGFNGPSFVKSHKDLNFIFASMTSGNRIRSYSYGNTGTLTAASNLGLNQASLSDIYYGATHYLYVARPTNNAVHYASINTTTGNITLIGQVSTNGTQPPYGVVVHPANWANYLYVTVKGTSNNVQLFNINTGTGAITWTANYATGSAPEKPTIVKKIQ